MKTKLVVEIETNNMNIINDDNGIQLTNSMEEQIHNAIKQWLKYNLTEEALNEVIITNSVPDFDFVAVDEWENLDNYGDLKITVQEDDSKEIITNIISNGIQKEIDDNLKEIPEEDSESDETEEITNEDSEDEIF